MNWKEYTLQQACSLITDGAHASPKSVEIGMPMASVKDLTNYGINISTCRLISGEDFQRLVDMNCQPHIGDVLIAKDGASALDTVCEFRQNVHVVLLSSVAILRPNSDILTSSYLHYYLDSPKTRQYMKSGFITGAAIPRIVLEDFKKVKIKIPPLPTQRKIAFILSAYDDLIENNTRRIRILEEMAQRIYREWFVHFRFPGHEGVRMVDSGTELGEVPEGWGVKRLGDICTILMGQSPESRFYNESGEGLPFHQGVTNFGQRFPTDKVYCTALNRLANQGDILLSVRAPVGRLNIARKRMVIGRGLCSIRNKEGFQCFTFQQLKEKFQEEDTMGGGTIFKAVTKEEMLGIQVIHPSRNILGKFEEIISPIFRNLEILTDKNNNHRQQRDLLLPRLVSGEVDVSELNIEPREE
jgi:type I restriction enzyme, S subunit